MDAHLNHTSFVHLMCATAWPWSKSPSGKKFLPRHLKKLKAQLTVDQRWATIFLRKRTVYRVFREMDRQFSFMTTQTYISSKFKLKKLKRLVLKRFHWDLSSTDPYKLFTYCNQVPYISHNWVHSLKIPSLFLVTNKTFYQVNVQTSWMIRNHKVSVVQ